ncbi:hypothetical protein B0H34DRAFT_664807 [Crassisporium funariophilum]|nr:hypothetical protein B0H34DRAFT_664807 [Crassisporium funariophilum]
MVEGHSLLVEFVEGFEELYYQRKTSRLHFCRQSLHALLHTGPEATRIGPGTYSSQWTMERMIGILGQEIRQPSNPFQNLSERGLRRARINALEKIIPDVAKKSPQPRISVDLGQGYTLLGSRDANVRFVNPIYIPPIRHYFASNGVQLEENWVPRLKRWARVELPTKQIVRTAWKENMRSGSVRISRNIMVSDVIQQGNYGEVQFFFRATFQDNETRGLALVSVYDPPDPDLLRDSSHALWVSLYRGNESLKVINITLISTCVAMVPFAKPPDGRFFVCEKMGLEIGYLGGSQEEDGDANDPDA